MRYFLISYAHTNGYGNLTCQYTIFPPEIKLLDAAKKQSHTLQAVILNIYEFKNETDYKLYRGEEL